MVASISDFRTKLSEEITLPVTGLVVRIRRVIADDFLGLGELPLPPAHPEALSDSEQTAFGTMALLRYTHRAIARGVLSPAMTDELDDGGKPVCRDDALHVSELYEGAPDDYATLAAAITKRSGLTQEVRDTVDTFRTDAKCEADCSAGGAVSLPADDRTGVDTGGALSDDQGGPDPAGWASAAAGFRADGGAA